MMAASLAFTAMAAVVKIARAEMGALELMCFRALAGIPVAAWLARGTGFRVVNRPLLGLRTALGFCAMACFFTAAKELSVADISLLAKLRPILVVLGAPLLLGSSERVPTLVWPVLALGLVGCVLIISPDLQVGSSFGLWAVAAAVFSAAAHLCIRVLGRTDQPGPIVFWYQVGVAIAAFVASSALSGQLVPAPPSHLWPHVVACGVTAAIGQVLMTKAYAAEKASVVAASAYVAPLIAVLIDWVVFADWPGATTILGGGLVVVGGLLLLRNPAPVAGKLRGA